MGFGQVGGRDLQEPDDDVLLVGGAQQVVAAEVPRKVLALSAALAELGQLARVALCQQPIIPVAARCSGTECAELGDALEALGELVHREDVDNVARDVARLLLFLALNFASLRGPATETERIIGSIGVASVGASLLAPLACGVDGLRSRGHPDGVLLQHLRDMPQCIDMPLNFPELTLQVHHVVGEHQKVRHVSLAYVDEAEMHRYRVSHLLVDLGWVDFDFILPGCMPSCFCHFPISPGRIGQTYIGTLKIKVNPTQSTSRWDTL